VLAYHFTEMPYPYFPPEAEVELNSPRVILPNKYFDATIGADLYNRYLDDYIYADDLGLEIMLNEHHQTATCTDAIIHRDLGRRPRSADEAREDLPAREPPAAPG
jgi:hypothetical protein